MISTETLDALKNIGLNLYERKIYIALLSKGIGSAREISEIGEIPRSRAYDVLESLADRGFAIIQHTKPLRYVAISPDMAISKQKTILKKDLESKIKRIDKFSKSESLEELENMFNNQLSVIDPSDISGSLKGNQSFNLHLKNMISSANDTIDIITTEDGLKNISKSHINTLQKAQNKGIKIRILTPMISKNMDIIKTLSNLTEIKIIKEQGSLPIGNMITIDKDQTIMMLTDDERTHSSQNISFWTDSDHFTGNFSKNIFNLIWKQTD